MRKFKIYHVDSFTNELFGGNPTIAVLQADSLSEIEMKKIAREMNLSETGFVLKSQKADFRLRFFTPPGNEIKLCVHATIGALSAISQEGLYGCTKTKNRLSVETNAGILEVEIDRTAPDSPRFIFGIPRIELIPAPYTLEEIVDELEIPKECIDFSKPLMLEKNQNYPYLAAKSLKSLEKISVNMDKAFRFCEKHQIVIICILTKGSFNPQNQLHARGFGPWVGIPEDPFTGSMQGGLAAYAISQGMIPQSKWIGVEQGHFMGRPGFVELEVTQFSPIQVRLHGQSRTVFTAEFVLP
jgi:trans-2,3-dihydro-3-hydroxyanthranilate isomerase